MDWIYWISPWLLVFALSMLVVNLIFELIDHFTVRYRTWVDVIKMGCEMLWACSSVLLILCLLIAGAWNMARWTAVFYK